MAQTKWMKPGMHFVACPSQARYATNGRRDPRSTRSPKQQEQIMKKLLVSALVIIASSVAASAALAQDAEAGKASFNKCLACHAIGEDAKNKVGPSSTASTAASPVPCRIIITRKPTRIPASPGTRPRSRNTSRIRRRKCPAPDGLLRHQEGTRGQRPLGLRFAIRQGRQNQSQVREAIPFRRFRLWNRPS